MSDPMTALDSVRDDAHQGRWTGWLVVFLRIMAALSMAKGLYHWSEVVGIGSPVIFEANALPWQTATVFFAVIDLVAAVGLWLAAAWGGVVWLTAAISMSAVELFFPQIFGGRNWVVFAEGGGILVYVALALMAARERPA